MSLLPIERHGIMSISLMLLELDHIDFRTYLTLDITLCFLIQLHMDALRFHVVAFYLVLGSFPCLHLGSRRPQLILLDHGLYKELDYLTRTNYASLWKVLNFDGCWHSELLQYLHSSKFFRPVSIS